MGIDSLLDDLEKIRSMYKTGNGDKSADELFDSVNKRVHLLKIENEIVENVNNALASRIETDNFYLITCDELYKMIKWDRVSIAIFEEALGIVTAFVLTKGFKTKIFPEKRNYSYKGSILEKIMETEEAVIINDTSKNILHTDKIHFKEGTLSRLAYPLKFNGKIVGSINFSSKNKDAFSKEQFSVLSKLSSVLAFMVNDNLEKEIIGNINNVLASNFAPEDLYHRIFDELYKLIRWDRVSIAVFEEARGIVTAFVLSRGYKTKAFPEKRNYSYKGSILEMVMKTEEPVIINDTADNLLETDKIHFKEGIRSRLAYPLRFKGEVIGSINISSNKVNNFNKNHYKILGQIAPILSFMVENTKLFMEAAKCQKDFKELTKTIDTPWM